VYNVTFSGNKGQYGAAIYNYKGVLNINSSKFIQNSDSTIYDVIRVYQGKMNIEKSKFSQNIISNNNGIIYNSGRSGYINTINRATFSKNTGRAIYHYSGTLRITNSTFKENSVNSSGGVIRNYDKLEIEGCTFSKNKAGVTSIGSLGGAIWAYSYGSLTILNTTFFENYASGKGGAIYSQIPIKLNFVTIVGNTAGVSGGDIYMYDASDILNIKNSILADNKLTNGTSENCYAQTISSQGKNFSTDTSCGSGFDVVTVEQLKLGELRNNKGPTPTIAIYPGSVAINAVTDCTDIDGNTITKDQRGIKRPSYGTKCDSGAYEYNPNAIVFRVVQPNGGESIPAGGNYTIKWEAPAKAVKFRLKYSNDNKSTWQNIANVGNVRQYNWNVPAQEGKKPKSFVKVVGL